MKKLSFNCLPDRLRDWTRQRLPAGACVDDEAEVEALYKALFPQFPTYTVKWVTHGIGCIDTSKGNHRRSVVVAKAMDRVVADRDIDFCYVTIEDTALGVESTFETLKSFGLLDGDAEIDSRRAQITADYNAEVGAKHKAEGTDLAKALGGLVLGAIAVILLLALIAWSVYRLGH